MSVKSPSLAFLLAAACATPSRGEATIHPRTIELGGSGSYASTSSDGIDRRALGFAPLLHFYPTPNFFLGPAASTFFEWTDYYDRSLVEMGGKAGFITSGGTQFTHVFFGAGAGLIQARESLAGSTGPHQEGYGYQVFAGLKFRLGTDFALTLQPTWIVKEVEDRDIEAFTIEAGFSGLLLL